MPCCVEGCDVEPRGGAIACARHIAAEKIKRLVGENEVQAKKIESLLEETKLVYDIHKLSIDDLECEIREMAAEAVKQEVEELRKLWTAAFRQQNPPPDSIETKAMPTGFPPAWNSGLPSDSEPAQAEGSQVALQENPPAEQKDFQRLVQAEKQPHRLLRKLPPKPPKTPASTSEQASYVPKLKSGQVQASPPPRGQKSSV